MNNVVIAKLVIVFIGDGLPQYLFSFLFIRSSTFIRSFTHQSLALIASIYSEGLSDFIEASGGAIVKSVASALPLAHSDVFSVDFSVEWRITKHEHQPIEASTLMLGLRYIYLSYSFALIYFISLL
jgi:hypothetical protein